MTPRNASNEQGNVSNKNAARIMYAGGVTDQRRAIKSLWVSVRVADAARKKTLAIANW
jgi:hypothetical protein